MFGGLFSRLYFLQVFLNSLAAGLGASFPFATYLFNPSDLFADHLKLTVSYHSFLPDTLHWSAPIARLEPLYNLFNSYLANPLYSDDPGKAATELTHFMLPPLTQVLFITLAKCLSSWDPLCLLAATFLACLAPAVLAIYICYKSVPWLGLKIAFLALISYPMIFALTRGHPVALLCGSLVMLSVTLYGARRKAISIGLCLLAISMRPNLFPILIFYVMSIRHTKLSRRLVSLVELIVLLIAANFLLYKIVNHYYPSFSMATFMQGYSFYSRGEEEAHGFSGIGSSLYGAERILLGFANLYTTLVPIIFKNVNIILGTAFSVLIALSCAEGRTCQGRGLFLTLTAVLILTPLLADYHLLPFLSLFTLPVEGKGRISVGYVQFTPLVKSGQDWRRRPTFSGDIDALISELTTIEKVTLCLILVPLAYYLVPSRLISIGAILRPALASVCLVIWLKDHIISRKVSPRLNPASTLPKPTEPQDHS